MRKPGEPLGPSTAAGLVIGDLSNEHERNHLGRGTFGLVVRGVATHPPPTAAAAVATHLKAAAATAGGGGGQPVAVKMKHVFHNPNLYGVRSPDGSAWNHQVTELMTELNTLLSFQHPHVVRVHCFGLQTVLGVELPGLIALRLCSEGTLAAWIEDDRFGDKDIARFTQHLIDAMHYLHERRNVHHDIKPANVFIDSDSSSGHNVLVVGDLGSAKAVRASMTHATGGARFSPAYLAPEVAVTEACSFETDAYAVSSVVVEMLTLAQVFDAEQAAAGTAARPLIDRGEPAATVATAKADAEATARRECANLAVAVTHTLTIADDCWVTRAMVAQLAEAIAQERNDRCTFAGLFEEGRLRRERLRAVTE